MYRGFGSQKTRCTWDKVKAAITLSSSRPFFASASAAGNAAASVGNLLSVPARQLGRYPSLECRAYSSTRLSQGLVNAAARWGKAGLAAGDGNGFGRHMPWLLPSAARCNYISRQLYRHASKARAYANGRRAIRTLRGRAQALNLTKNWLSAPVSTRLVSRLGNCEAPGLTTCEPDSFCPRR